MPEYADITAIASGYDVALVDLDLITSLSAGGVSFLQVYSPAKYRRGEKRVKANGAKGYAGYKSKQWLSGFMTLAQFEYIVATYEGPITAYSWLNTTTPARFNATLDMGDVADYEEVNTIQHGWGLKDVVWSLTRIEVLA